MSAPIPAEVIAEALAKHHDTGEHSCDYHCAGCGASGPFREFAAHQASVIAALPDIAIVPRRESPREQTEVERLFQEHLDNENPDLKRHMMKRAAGGES